MNLLALLLFLLGTGVYAWAWVGMRRLEGYVATPDAEHWAGMAQFNHYWNLSRLGLWLVVAALVVAVVAAIAAIVVRRRARPPVD